MKYWILLFLCVWTVNVQAQRPLVVVDEKSRPSVFIEAITGDQTQATRVLENDLRMVGVVAFAERGQADYVLQGSLTGDNLRATLLPRGSTVPKFSKTYSGAGDWRRAVHLFADEVVEATTGLKGIASSRVVFISAHSGSKEVYIMDMDGANVKPLTNDKVISLGPKFDYSGRRVAYTSYRSNFPDVWVMDLQNSTRRRVAFFPGLNSHASFSPDGSRLALILSKDGNTELYTIASEGGSPQRLTRTRGTEASPTWSPRGDKIAFVSDDRGAAQIFVISPEGGQVTRIPTYSTYATEPDWSPDGTKLVYSVRMGGQFQIVMTDMGNMQQTALTSSGSNENPSWTRNSRHIVHVRNGQLYLLDSVTKQSIPIANSLTKNSEPNASK